LVPLVPHQLDSDSMSMEGWYESANRQDRLTAMIAGYTITLSDTKVTCNSFFIVLISKTTTFTYEIKHLYLLTQTLLLSITSNTIFSIHYTKNIANYSALSKALGCISRNPTWTRIDWAWRAHMSRQISNVVWQLGLKGAQKLRVTHSSQLTHSI
jgi:hypothetical protein